MPRLRRIFVPDLSVHVIQRGHNRASIFHEEVDYRRFLDVLSQVARRHAVRVHGFVLMTNHVHLIVTPSDAKGLPRTIKEVGGRYVPYFNRKYDRIGTLWTSRYRGLLIQDERYWLTCLRYIEQNPVRASMVKTPEDYRWSSYSAHAFGEWPTWLAHHPTYLALGATPEDRQARYRSLCGTTGSDAW